MSATSSDVAFANFDHLVLAADQCEMPISRQRNMPNIVKYWYLAAL
jgi:hypothetical protein